MQFTRTDQLHEKVSNVVNQLSDDCEIRACAGIARTPDLSFLVANLTNSVTQIDEPEKFLGPLPIDILAIPFQR